MGNEIIVAVILAVLAVLVIGWLRSRSANSNEPQYVEIDRTAAADVSVREPLERGQKIEAIKAYRNLTGAGLKEAKDALDQIEREMQGIPTPLNLNLVDARPKPATAPVDLDDHFRDLIRKGNKIEAIKIYREYTGVGLKEAKDAVEAIEREMNL